MKTLIVTLLYAAAAFSQEQQQTTPGGQQQQQPARQRDRKAGEARRETMKKLRADLDQASARAKFTDEQRKQFEDAREVLRQQAQRGGRRNRGGAAGSDSANAGNPRAALQTLRGLVQSDAFQAEDRELLRKDFEGLRKSGARSRKEGRTPRKSAA